MINLPRPDHHRHFSLANLVYATFALFLAGFYFVPNAVDLYKYFIALVFLPGLFLLRDTLARAWDSFIWRALLAYLLYMLCSSLWSESVSYAALWRDIRYVAYILVFVLLLVYFFSRDVALPEAILTGTVLIAAAAAAYSIFIAEPPALLGGLAEHRSIGPGITDNPNPSAFVYGLFAVVALHRAALYRGTAMLPCFTACFALLGLFAVLTQSNTGLLALITACAMLLIVHGQQRSVRTAGLGAVLVAMGAGYLAWSLGLLGGETDKGFSARLPIWQFVLERWREAPLLGNGLQAVVHLNASEMPSRYNYAHSLFLATARDGGAIGLLLLLLLGAAALREGLRRVWSGNGTLYLALLCFGLVIVLADVDQPITRPRELWIILWLPLACLIASELGLADNSQSAGKNKAS